jgi:general stress protein 26
MVPSDQLEGTSMSHDTTPQEKLWDMIKDIKFGMFVHRHPGGMLHAVPLTTQNKKFDEGNTLYFFISQSSEMFTNVKADGNVNVTYASPDKDSYVSLSGDATVSYDRAKIEELFTPIAKAWFKGGVDDPDLALLTIRIHHAEYWDMKESQMKQLFKMAKAAVTGDGPHLKADHKEVHL